MRGTKRKRKDGVWELRVYVGRDPITGNPRQISKTFHGGARAADDALRDLVEKYGEGSPDGFGNTFGQLLDRWLTECERLDLSPTTIRTYRSQVEGTIRPDLGKIQLAKLTPKHLDDLYREMKERGVSPKTIRNHHAIISSSLHQAVRWGWVKQNPADRAKPPRVTQQRVKAPSVEEVRAIVEAAEQRDSRLAPLLMLGALTGLRRGELCALHWEDVDLERGELTVARSLVITPGGMAEKSTKTNRERRVALDSVAIAVLQHHLANSERLARRFHKRLSPNTFVFSPYVHGLSPFRPDNVTSFFSRVRKELGQEHVRLHDLRHFTATQLIGAGVDVRTVAGRLGHSDPSVTLRVYSHALEERDRAAAAVMGRLLGTSTPKDEPSTVEDR